MLKFLDPILVGEIFINTDGDRIQIVTTLPNNDIIGVPVGDNPVRAMIYSPGGIAREMVDANLSVRLSRGEQAWSKLSGDHKRTIKLIAAELPTKKIAAVKIIREMTGLGLGEAKDIIEDCVGDHHGGFTKNF